MNASSWAKGSPPVTSTSLHPNSRTRSITSSTETYSPPLNVYSLSHHVQRMGQPVSRTKEQGRPACVDSPWMERNVSVTLSTNNQVLSKHCIDFNSESSRNILTDAVSS